jgi:threonine dehydrogenase-like Zn-dependent dehydrogenase
MSTNTMRAIQLIANREIALGDVPRPVTPADGLVLKTRATSICSTDISYFEGHLIPEEYPSILGHEYLGEVADIGDNYVQDPRNPIGIGDRIVYWGQTDFGGFAEYRSLRPIFSGQVKTDEFYTVRDFYDDYHAAAVKVPDELDDTVASFIEPVTGALRSILTNPPRIGDRILVLGSGPIGIIAGSIFAKLFAANTVDSVDLNPARNVGAKNHFAHNAYTPDELRETTEDSSYDYVFDTLPTINTSRDNDPRRLAMLKLRPRGKYVLYGASQEMQKFDTWLMLSKGITIVAAPFCVRSFPMHNSANVIGSAMRMLKHGVVNGGALGTRLCHFDDFATIKDIVHDYRSTLDLKTVIQYGDVSAAVA